MDPTFFYSPLKPYAYGTAQERYVVNLADTLSGGAAARFALSHRPAGDTFIRGSLRVGASAVPHLKSVGSIYAFLRFPQYEKLYP
jgi:hypothetical protein